ncbi:MAG: GxxExxY protein [Citrobacter freundii]|nr:MAG: GxxExxY protein [Citrobacter freundii]
MKSTKESLIFEKECYKIIGLCMKVHSKMGRGYKEIVYKDALEIEFKRNNIPYEREKKFKVFYDGIQLKRQFIADFIVYGSIILEIKSMSTLTDDCIFQTLNYIKVATLQLGLVITFGAPGLLFKRVISTT